jgi:hypothetical protein
MSFIGVGVTVVTTIIRNILVRVIFTMSLTRAGARRRRRFRWQARARC